MNFWKAFQCWEKLMTSWDESGLNEKWTHSLIWFFVEWFSGLFVIEAKQCPGFLNFLQTSVRIFVSYLCIPEAINNYSCDMKPEWPAKQVILVSIAARAIKLFQRYGLPFLLREGCIRHSFINKCHFICCTPLTKRSALISKVGVSGLSYRLLKVY